MNGFTFLGIGIDLGIMFYFYKIYGKNILEKKNITEICIAVLSSLLILTNTYYSTIDTVTLIVSSITAVAIALANALIVTEEKAGNKNITIPFFKKKQNKDNKTA